MLGLLCVAAATACGAETPCLHCVESPWAETVPAALRLVVGDSAPVSLRIHAVPANVAAQTVRWTSAQPDVARLDTAVLAVQAAVVRAVAVGAAVLTVHYDYGAPPAMTLSVPVTVTARP